MEDTRCRWERAYAEALDFDLWGQVEEAKESYQRLQTAAAAEYVENILQLTMQRREGVGKLAAVLKMRIQELHSTDKGIGLPGMKRVRPWMKELIVTDNPFPLPSVNPHTVLGVTPQAAVDDDDEEAQSHSQAEPMHVVPGSAAIGSLRPAPQLHQGDLALTIWIEKWGFKETSEFLEPRVTVSVRNAKGELLEPVQETPTSSTRTAQYLFLESTVHIQTALGSLPPGSAIFFEMKHWKPKKQKKSCKAYCFLEMDEMKSGPVTLEVYKKPASYARSKRPSLLTVKPLYLHLSLSVQRQ